MVYQLAFEDINQLMKYQIMNSSKLYSNLTRPASLSENSILMQCMQKLSQYPAGLNDPRVLQEANGRNRAVEVDGQAAGCTPRPRWCPTPEQIQVLEGLFNSGTTTPSRDMIVEIAACLKQYGNIVEANVFYWFQNRKARAKRKLQLLQAASGSDDNPAAARQQSYAAIRASTRRVSPKTACKSSPRLAETNLIKAASDHQYTCGRDHRDHQDHQLNMQPLIITSCSPISTNDPAANIPNLNLLVTTQAARDHAASLPSHSLLAEAPHGLLEESCSRPSGSEISTLPAPAPAAAHERTPYNNQSPSSNQDQHYHQLQLMPSQYLNDNIGAYIPLQQDINVPAKGTPTSTGNTSLPPTSTPRGPESVSLYAAPLRTTQNHQLASSLPYNTARPSLLLPDKRSWIDALQQFLLHGSGNHMQEADHIGLVVSSLGSSSSHNQINLNMQQPPAQPLLDQNLILNQGAILNTHPSTHTLPSTNLSDCMASQSDTGNILGVCCNRLQYAVPSPQAYNNEQAPGSPIPSLVSATSESGLSISPSRFPNCDHLLLWEALAPYSIGS